ncbi:MAG: FAD-binding protein [Myxococcales bacterium]|nr:FAD-binding protein [Myxococcales bacterium]
MARRVGNFGETWSFVPARIEQPTTTDELVEIVRGARQLRVMGARHSWSRGIVTEDTLVSLDRMKRILHVDRERLRVRVQAGIRLRDLIGELDALGLALANLGSIDEQSLAGAVCTGTHGTGIGFRCLADQVEGLRLIDGRGDERAIERDDPDFPAVVVGLGAFGVVHEMTLAVVPRFQMHAITESCPFDEVIERLDAFVDGSDHFKFWWFVPNDDAVVFRQRRTDQPRNDSDLKRWFKDEFLGFAVYRAALAVQRLNRRRLVPLTNRILAGEYARRFERICKSHVAFLTPKPPVHRETEWAFDYADAKPLLRDYRKLLLDSGHAYSMPQEVRFTRGDALWASPAYGRDSIWLSMYNIDSEANWNDQLQLFETFARAHGGRPHWGKEATFDTDYLLESLPKLGDFFELIEAYDPDGRFANAWIRGLTDD